MPDVDYPMTKYRIPGTGNPLPNSPIRNDMVPLREPWTFDYLCITGDHTTHFTLSVTWVNFFQSATVSA